MDCESFSACIRRGVHLVFRLVAGANVDMVTHFRVVAL